MAKKKNQVVESIKELVGDDCFYIYYNWHANQDNKIHRGSCGFCKYGFGTKGIRGKKGVFIGPFSTPELAEEFLKMLALPEQERHSCC